MGKGFALVHWIQSKKSEILKCQMIPERYRRENAVVNLKCRHKLSGTSETRLAKIVKIEQNKANLHNITVDTETGTIIQMSANKLPKTTVKKSEILTKKLLKKKDSKKKKKTGKNKKSKHIDDNTDSDESSSSESSSEESANEPEDDSDGDDSGAMKSLLSCVTSDSIKFVRKLLTLMEKAYKKKQLKNSRKKEIIIEDPDPIAIAEPETDNLQSSLEGFLPPMTIAAIFHRCQNRNDWKKITTDILVEIYGKQLAYLSAKGSRGAQGIDPAVYRVVYDLINMRLGWILPAKEFVRHVNKVCSNRKKAQKLKMMNSLPPETWNDVQVKLELPTTSTHGEPDQPTASGSSSIPTYQQYMSKSMDDDSKPIITSVRSIADSVPSSSIDRDTPSTEVNSYPEYTSEQSSNHMENNQVSSRYLGGFLH